MVEMTMSETGTTVAETIEIPKKLSDRWLILPTSAATAFTATWRCGLVLIVVEVEEWRREAGVIANHFGIVGAVEPVKSVARDGDFALLKHDALVRSDFDNLHVVLITDEGVAIVQAYGAGGQRVGDASGTRVGGVGPDHVAAHIHLQNAVVVGVGYERVAVVQAAGEGGAAELSAGGASVAPDNFVFARNFDNAVVGLISDEDVTVLQKFGAVRAVELIGCIAGDTGLSVLPDDFFVERNLDNALVALIGDQDVAVGEPRILHRRVELVRAGTGNARLSILPDDLRVWSKDHHAVVGAAIGAGRLGACRDAGARD